MNASVSKRKSVGISLLVIGIVFIVLGLVSLFNVLRDLNKFETEGTRNFNLLSPAELSEEPYVEGRVEFVFEVFAEEYTTNYGVRTSDASDKLYYLIPLVSDGYIENFVTLEATPRYYDTLDQIYDETWDPELPEVYTELYLEDARVKHLPSDIEDILYDWCETGEFYQNGSFVDWCIESDFFGTSDPEVILASVLPYMIVPDSKPGSIGISVGVVMLGIGLILLLIAIVRIKKAKHTPAAQTSEDGASPYFDAQAPAASTNSSKFCPHCGTPLEDNAHFCPSCGAKIDDITQ